MPRDRRRDRREAERTARIEAERRREAERGGPARADDKAKLTDDWLSYAQADIDAIDALVARAKEQIEAAKRHVETAREAAVDAGARATTSADKQHVEAATEHAANAERHAQATRAARRRLAEAASSARKLGEIIEQAVARVDDGAAEEATHGLSPVRRDATSAADEITKHLEALEAAAEAASTAAQSVSDGEEAPDRGEFDALVKKLRELLDRHTAYSAERLELARSSADTARNIAGKAQLTIDAASAIEPKSDDVGKLLDDVRDAANQAIEQAQQAVAAAKAAADNHAVIEKANTDFRAAAEQRDSTQLRSAADIVDRRSDATDDAYGTTKQHTDTATEHADRAHELLRRAQAAIQATNTANAEFDALVKKLRKPLGQAVVYASHQVDAARQAATEARQHADDARAKVEGATDLGTESPEAEKQLAAARESAQQAGAAAQLAEEAAKAADDRHGLVEAAAEDFESAAQQRDPAALRAASDTVDREADASNSDADTAEQHALTAAAHAADTADLVGQARAVVDAAETLARDVADRLVERATADATAADDAARQAKDIGEEVAKRVAATLAAAKAADTAARHASQTKATEQQEVAVQAAADARQHYEAVEESDAAVRSSHDDAANAAERALAAAQSARQHRDDGTFEQVEPAAIVAAEGRTAAESALAEARARLDDIENALRRAEELAKLAREAAVAAAAADLAANGSSTLRPPRPTGPVLETVDDEPVGLEAEVPLLFLPVRIETRFGNPGETTTPLRIRIYPDRIQVDDGQRVPTPGEVDVAHRYWKHHHEARDEHDRQAAWQWLVDRVDIHRAGYLSRLTKPVVIDGKPTFPDVDTETLEAPGQAALLPHRYVAIGWSKGAEVFRQKGALIDGDPYHTSPDLRSAAVETTADGLTVTPHMRWMIDYDNAVTRGMAITIEIDNAVDTIDTLLVVGVDQASADASSERFAELLATHTISQGFAFVPQGTPTNNTDTVESGWTRLVREQAEIEAQQDRERTGVTGPNTNANRLSAALGITDRSAIGRQPFAGDDEWQRSRAMRTLLFDAVIGRYLTELLATDGTPVLTSGQLETFRSWFRDHVTGGAPLPAVRIGSQPYGVLPAIRRSSVEAASSPTGRTVARIVDQLSDEWARSFDDGVPRLDHNTGEVGNGLPGDIAGVLAGEPHPVDLVTRELRSWARILEGIDGLLVGNVFTVVSPLGGSVDDLELTWVEADNGFVGEFFERLEDIAADAPGLYNELLAMREALGEPATIEQQLILWTKFRELVYAISLNPFEEGALMFPDVRRQLNNAIDILPVVDDVIGQLSAHEQRQRPLSWLDLPNFNGVLTESNPELIVSKFDFESTPISFPLVALDGDDQATVADRITRAVNGELPMSEIAVAPLLTQLLAYSSTALAAQPAAEINAAVEALVDTPIEQLEWLLRETLGLGMHRLDAWETALATERLEDLREKRPTGTHLGSFAWVTDLVVPQQTIERASQGFLHAPSMAQAATSAVIRSAWEARGSGDAQSPAALDLRSNRYRYASWLIEGVRAGQSLGDMLGHQFERLCHDLGIDEQIAHIRILVATAHKRDDGLEDPVDGIELMELFQQGGVDNHIAGVRADFGNERADTLDLLLQGLNWSFDAIDDALVGEATHHVLGGNFERAAAAIESTSGGGAPPPELTAMSRSVSTRTINHKVVLLTPAEPTPSSNWGSGLRDRLSPAFEALAALLLPDPNDVGLSIVNDDGSIAVSTLGSLSLSALDAVHLGSDDPTTVSPGLAEIVRLSDNPSGVVAPDVHAGEAPISFEEFQIIAIGVRRLLSERRVVTAADLDPDLVGSAAPQPAVADPAALLGEYIGEVTDVDLTHDTRRSLALLGIVGPDDDMQRVIEQRAAQALGAVGKSATEITGALLGRSVPIGNVIGVDDSESDFDPKLASDREVQAWLHDISKVRPDIDTLTTTEALGMLVGVEPGLRGVTSQSPRESGDQWAATGVPTPETGGRNVVTALWAGSGQAPSGSVVGLVIDQWSEQIPDDSTVTGIAVHYDAPSQRPPQAWILGVPEDDQPWTLDSAIEMLLHTFHRVEMRTVAPEDLGDFGHTIPTVYSDRYLASTNINPELLQ